MEIVSQRQPVATGADGITAAMAGFQWKHPSDIPLSRPVVARASVVANAAIHPPMSTVTGVTAASEIAEAFLEGMHTFTAQMKESAKSQLSLTEEDKLDKPVPGTLILEPEMGHKITVSVFLVWLKSVEEAWGKVSANLSPAGNCQVNQRLY